MKIFLSLPLVGRVAHRERSERCDGRGAASTKGFFAHCRALPPPGASRHPPHKGEGLRSYTDAVVTPPSTTMVWPVMKVEASEAR